MTDPLARALRELRGSPAEGDAGDAAGHADAEDADTLRRILAGLGWALLPLALDAGMRRAIWEEVAARAIQTPASRETFIAARIANDHQQAADLATWRAIHAEAERRLGDG